MNDEKFVFINDVKEKKITARSARKQRTHCGKGGNVRFPSDNLSKKELNAMNGEVKSYKLNSPMTWAEFKEMPDDVKVLYLNGIRSKWQVPFSKIAEMLGLSQQHFARETKRLGFKDGHAKKKWDKEGFYTWMHGIEVPRAVTEEVDEDLAFEQEEAEEITESTSEVVPVVEEDEVRAEPIRASTTPISGNMVFECPANQALEMMAQVLGNANVLIRINWEVLPSEYGER